MDNKILLKYIMGKAGKNERQQVLSWIRESQENMDQFAMMKAQYVFSGFTNKVIPQKRRVMPVIVRAAAILSIPLLAGCIWLVVSKGHSEDLLSNANHQVEVLQAQSPGEITYVVNPGVKSTVFLPDSSVVKLNGDSQLIVPQIFDPQVREMTLLGEGYFEITHHDDWPMLIHTSKGVTIKVLGTTFDLSAYEDDDNVKLTLIEGRVVVHDDKSRHEHVVKPEQEIRIAENASTESRRPLPTEVKPADIHKNTGWVNGELIFDNTPMPEIIKQLERWYGVKVHVVDEKIMKYHLTATFTTESITRVLELIKFSSLIDYSINGEEVYIKPQR